MRYCSLLMILKNVASMEISRLCCSFISSFCWRAFEIANRMMFSSKSKIRVFWHAVSTFLTNLRCPVVKCFILMFSDNKYLTGTVFVWNFNGTFTYVFTLFFFRLHVMLHNFDCKADAIRTLFIYSNFSPDTSDKFDRRKC